MKRNYCLVKFKTEYFNMKRCNIYYPIQLGWGTNRKGTEGDQKHPVLYHQFHPHLWLFCARQSVKILSVSWVTFLCLCFVIFILLSVCSGIFPVICILYPGYQFVNISFSSRNIQCFSIFSWSLAPHAFLLPFLVNWICFTFHWPNLLYLIIFKISSALAVPECFKQ